MFELAAMATAKVMATAAMAKGIVATAMATVRVVMMAVVKAEADVEELVASVQATAGVAKEAAAEQAEVEATGVVVGAGTEV